jgi:hypothetical protein
MARSQWQQKSGRCAVCGKRGRVMFHHLVLKQHIKKEGGDVWDFRNALPVGVACFCHADHHAAMHRIPRALVPESAIAFAEELFGAERAELYWSRYYASASRRQAS